LKTITKADINLKKGFINQTAHDEMVTNANNELEDWKKTLNEPS
jgi:hypothetical protein